MNALKAAGWTAVATFLAIFSPAALGWLGEISSTGRLSDPSVLRSAAVSAVAAAVSAAITALLVVLRQQPWFPGTAPIYPVAGDAHHGGNIDAGDLDR